MSSAAGGNWGRIEDGNATMYCCWLYNVYNCKDEQDFQLVTLACFSLGIAGFIFILSFILYLTLVLKMGKNLFLRPMYFATAYLILNAIHSLILYTDGYRGSAYATVFIFLAFYVGTLASVVYFFSIIEAFGDISHNFNKAPYEMILKILLPVSFFPCFISFFVLGYLIDSGSEAADALYEFIFTFAAVLVICLLVLVFAVMWNLFKLLSPVYESSSRTFKRQLRMATVTTSMALFMDFCVAVSLFILGYAQNLYKNMAFSKGMMILGYIMPTVGIVGVLLLMVVWDYFKRRNFVETSASNTHNTNTSPITEGYDNGQVDS